ncbi:MAG: hypothetical protein Kow0042_08770 [Calditrichia bacterium]
MLWEISLLIIAIAFLLLVVVFIPSIIQIRSTARSVKITSDSLNQRLPDILNNLDHITADLAGATSKIGNHLDGFSGIVTKLQEMVDDVVQFEKSIRYEIEEPVTEFLTTLTGIIKGFRKFFEVLRERR